MKLADLDLIITATAVSTNSYVNSSALDFQRYEFLEFICRVAEFEVKQRAFKKLPDAIEYILEKKIYPN